MTLLRFADAGTITMAPGEARTIEVITSPPATYEVDFALLGDALDGALDSTQVTADDAGHARVTLRAPTKSGTFRLRASIPDGPSAETAVAVSDHGFGTVLVKASYAGKRDVKKWVASVVASTTCKALASTLPGEAAGAIIATSAPGGAAKVSGAPVGPTLAVTLRAGHFAWGCLDVANLSAGASLEVDVPVNDKPLDLGASKLDLRFDFQPDGEAYGKLLEQARELLAEAVVPNGDQTAALLDAMQARAPSPGEFAKARAAQSWDGVVGQSLGGSQVDLANKVRGWATAGLIGQAPALWAHLDGHAGKSGPTISVVTFAGVSVADAGIPSSLAVTFGAEADDSVTLSGKIPWEPSRFVGAFARHAAQAELGPGTMADELAAVVNCASIASLLAGDPTCDAACMTTLCHDALGDRWMQALNASASNALLGSVDFTAAGNSTVDDVAAPSQIAGTWVGSVASGAAQAAVQGAVVGDASTPAPPP